MAANIDDHAWPKPDANALSGYPFPDIPPPPAHQECGPEADSGYGSNDATQSIRAADGDGVWVANPRPTGADDTVWVVNPYPPDTVAVENTPPTDTIRVQNPLPADRIRVEDIEEGAETPPQTSQSNPRPSRPTRPPKPFPLAHRKDVFRIDHEPTPSIRQRWLNIEGPLSKGLSDELQDFATPFKGASMRLVMLGKANSTPADARPSIVVFCLEAQWKRVRKFFERRQVRELYRPRGGEPDVPIFDFYLGPPLKEKARGNDVKVFLTGENIFYCLDPCATLCGTPIKLRHSGSGSTSIATLGGIVKVADAMNRVVCYGITAGHVMPPACTPASVIHDDVMDMDDPPGPTNPWTASGEDQFIGSVVDECLEQRESEDGRYYDWALCRLPHYRLAPNCLRLQEHAPRHYGHENKQAGRLPELHSVDTTFKTATEDICVVVMTGSGGPKRGWLSTLPCPVMLGPGTEFITAFTVSFPQMDAIRDGDSGSWVVNESTLEVIGHIVATDELGDAYVIPLADVFEDIKRRFHAKSVELASASSIRSVGVVPGSLNMVGTPQLDAIRGNGVHGGDFAVSQDGVAIQNSNQHGTAVTDSGYGSTGEFFEFDAAEFDAAEFPGDRVKVVDLNLLPIPRLRSPASDATPGNVWFSIGNWAS
ncbi:hypothetical protein C8A01DRAFT_14731 [Parachaetomium inaequale]|uniref:Uncharacterized protein n=1 Tax=Parachaetomium inaequale TaxID=2588326 RepID=A0AAN6PKB0_9PEZI|nr:hypothetical protein C8A01DRAFT_14731 [Parachaetomium inaequale]